MNQVLRQEKFSSGQTFQIVQGDITQETVDAIVNAANSQLQHGGGVAGLIAHRGGPQIQQESNAWVCQHGPVTHAQPAYTRAGNLPHRYVIHAVGPVYGEDDEDAKLGAAISGALQVAEQLELQSLALPAISTGIFGFPKERAARIIFAATEQYFSAHPESRLTQVRLTLFDQPTVDAFLQAYDKYREAT